MPTRVVHYVRCRNPNSPSEYVDIGALDAISFRGPNGYERVYWTNARKSSNSTRKTHFEELKNTEDETQYLEVEILDAFSLRGPNGYEICLKLDRESLNTTRIIDKTDLGLSQFPAQLSRVSHISKVTQDGNTDKGTEGDNKDVYIAVLKTDMVAYRGPNGYERLFAALRSKYDERDTTKYVTDSDGNKAPPDNKDPNEYVRFTGGGLNLGKKPVSNKTGIAGPVNQGPLWWIEKISHDRPWYWWIKKYQPKDFSFIFGGFELLPSYPVIYILGVNNPEVPIDPVGYDTLDDAVTNGSPDLLGYTFTDVNLPPSLPRGDYGQFVLDAPPTDDDGQDSYPNIWQATGMKQPFDQKGNPAKPNKKQAQDVVENFRDRFNNVAEGSNQMIATWRGAIDTYARPNAPPVWDFVMPSKFLDPFYPEHRHAYCGSIPIGLYVGGIPLYVAFPYATAYKIEVGQLDDKKWDTSQFPPLLKLPDGTETLPPGALGGG